MTTQEVPSTPGALQARIDGYEIQAALDGQLIEDLQAEDLVHRDKIGHLTTALHSARRIGAATGILMSGGKLTEQQAFELLRSTSQSQNRKVRDLADDVLLIGQLP